MCCSALQCVAVRCSALQFVAVRCSALQCVAVRCSALQCVAARCSVLQCVAVRCSALQCVAVRCSALQCVAVRTSEVRAGEPAKVSGYRSSLPAVRYICQKRPIHIWKETYTDWKVTHPRDSYRPEKNWNIDHRCLRYVTYVKRDLYMSLLTYEKRHMWIWKKLVRIALRKFGDTGHQFLRCVTYVKRDLYRYEKRPIQIWKVTHDRDLHRHETYRDTGHRCLRYVTYVKRDIYMSLLTYQKRRT